MSTPVPLRPVAADGKDNGKGAAHKNGAPSVPSSPVAPESQAQAASPAPAPRASDSSTRKVLNMKKPMRLGEIAIEKSIQGVAFVSLIFIALIFVFIFREAFPLFTGKATITPAQTDVGASETYGEDPGAPMAVEHPELEQRQVPFKARHLLVKDWQPVSLDPKYGIMPLLLGSLKVTLIALLLAGPIGIFAALYTSNFAPKWSREFMKPIIEILAGFPSVVVGFFALVIMATILQNLFGYQYRLNAFVGGVAMALAVIPIIYTVSEDALNAVPKVMTEASLALGATKWETALFVVLPSATPGIFAAVILGFGRAFGETMIVLMATGNAALLSPSLVDPVRTLSATIGAEMAEVVFGDVHYRVLFFLGSLLFVISFGLNAIAEFFVRARLLKQFKGA
ncbi:MAG: phosphate transporter permease [Fibrobacteres bacterium]|nr:phosphate transporter permease [Fibrobacterota bacterium]